MQSTHKLATAVVILAVGGGLLALPAWAKKPAAKKPAKAAAAKDPTAATESAAGAGDWTQWGGSPARNNTPEGTNIPSEWSIGKLDKKTGQWSNSKNIKWVARLGSQTYGNPVIANGKVYVGTNNGAGWLKRYPAAVDLGCLICFNEADGKFLWQHSSEKLPIGEPNDWPLMGICCAPLVEGNRLWFVSSRGEVVCLDTEGFLDDENDGPFKDEKVQAKDEADAIWYLDMMSQLGTSQHNMASCSVTAAGDILFVNTSNGVDATHSNVTAPEAPSFIAVDKNTGKVLWTDRSPGVNILHGQWSSPSYAVLGGVPQVLFGGGDGWLYSFKAEGTADGKAELLWKFDCNPKDAKYSVSGRSTRNHIIGTPLIYDGLVYVAVGEDPEHGEGNGHLWCIDPTKRGDVSTQQVFNTKDPKKPIPHKRLQACVPEDGDIARDNPNSAAVWHFAEQDVNGNGKIEFEEQMHRTCGTAAIKDNLLFIADFSGLFHCLDPKTGKQHWSYDMLAPCWGSPLIVDGKVYIGDEDGDVTIFKLSDKLEEPIEINMATSVYSTPVVANNILFIETRPYLFAIQAPGEATAAAGGGQ